MASVTAPMPVSLSVSLSVSFEITSLSSGSVWVTLLLPIPSIGPSLLPFPLSLPLISSSALKLILFALQLEVHAHILKSSSIYWLTHYLHSCDGPQTISLLVNLNSNNYALLPLDISLAADFVVSDTNPAHIPIFDESHLTLVVLAEPPRNIGVPQDFDMGPPAIALGEPDPLELLDPQTFLRTRYYDTMYSLGTPLLYFAKLALTRFRVLCESSNVACGPILERLFLSLNKLDQRHLGVFGVIGLPHTQRDQADNAKAAGRSRIYHVSDQLETETLNTADPPHKSISSSSEDKLHQSDVFATLAGDEVVDEMSAIGLDAENIRADTANQNQKANIGGTSGVDEDERTTLELAHDEAIAKFVEGEQSHDYDAIHLPEEQTSHSIFQNTHRHVLEYMAQYTTTPDFAQSADLKVSAAHSAKLYSLVLELKIREAQLQLLISLELVGSWGVNEQEFLDSGIKKQAKEAQRKLRHMATSLVRRKKSKKRSVVPTFLGMGVNVNDQGTGSTPLEAIGIGQHEVFTLINAIIDRLALWDTLLISAVLRTESHLFAFFAHVIVPYYSKRFPILTKYIVNEYKQLSVKVVSERDIEKEARRAKRSLRRESAPFEQAPTLHRALTEIDTVDDPNPSLKRSKSNLSSRSMIRREVDMALTQKSLQDAKIILTTPAETPQQPSNIFKTSRKRKDLVMLKQPQVEATPAKPRPGALLTSHQVQHTPRATRTHSMPAKASYQSHETPRILETPRHDQVVPVTPFARRRLSFGSSAAKGNVTDVFLEGRKGVGSDAYSDDAPINSPFLTVMSTPSNARSPGTPMKSMGDMAQLMNSQDSSILQSQGSNGQLRHSKTLARQSESHPVEQIHELIIFSSPERGANPWIRKTATPVIRSMGDHEGGSENNDVAQADADRDANPSSKSVAEPGPTKAAKKPRARPKPRPQGGLFGIKNPKALPPSQEVIPEATGMSNAATVDDRIPVRASESSSSISVTMPGSSSLDHIPLAQLNGFDSNLDSDSDFGMLTLASVSAATQRTYTKRGARKGR